MKSGQKVLVSNKLSEAKITKVGRKYVYVKERANDLKFYVDSLLEVSDSQCRLHLSKEDYENEVNEKDSMKESMNEEVDNTYQIELMIHEIQKSESIHLSDVSRAHIERLVKEISEKYM